MDLRKYIQGQDYALRGSGVTATATTINLTSFTFPDGTEITTSDIGTLAYGVFEPETNREENFSFTTVTQNADGSATLTGVTRGLKFKSPYDQDTALRQSHAGGTTVRISNSAPFYDEFANTENDETISQTWTFTNPNYPRMDEAVNPPVDDEQLATKKYVDDTAGGTPISINRVVVAGTAGETVSAGQLVYLDETDNEWKLADASASATSDNVQLGIAQGAGTNGNPITGGVLIVGRDSNQSGLTAGDRVYAGDTAGAIVNSAGTVEVELGHAVSATAIDFQPKFASYTTKLQRNAMVGNNTDIAVGTGNKYVTQTGLQDSAEVYAASATGNDTYVVTLSPAPTALHNGMTIRVKFDVANTGASTLNVNGLGALAIVTAVSTATATGDIVANMIGELIYNSTGTVWQLVNPASAILIAPTYTAGTTTRNLATASGNQTIAHGLGTTPKLIKLSVIQASTLGGTDNYSFGTYDRTTNNGIYRGQNSNAQYYVGNSTTYCVNIYSADTSTTAPSTASATMDSTNITLAWTRGTGGGDATGTAYILWEAYA